VRYLKLNGGIVMLRAECYHEDCKHNEFEVESFEFDFEFNGDTLNLPVHGWGAVCPHCKTWCTTGAPPWVVSFHNYAGDGYAIGYKSKENCIKVMKDDVKTEIKNLKDGGYKYRKLIGSNGVDLYANDGDIYHEWKIETGNEFTDRIIDEMNEVSV
jgi:hypothetical protein